MFCDEIQQKWAELTRDTSWSARMLDQGTVIVKTDSLGAPARALSRPVPAPARSGRAADLALGLINAFYVKPADFRTCGAEATGLYSLGAHPLTDVGVRAWVLRNLANPPEAPAASYLRQTPNPPAQIASQLARVIASVLMVEGMPRTGASAGGLFDMGVTAQIMREDIVSAVCDIVVATGAADTTAWPLLWAWASGAPPNTSMRAPLVSTRASALHAIGAIALRRPEFATRATTVDQLAKLARSINELPPPITFREEQERQAFAVAAGVAAGDIQQALMTKGQALPPALADPDTYVPPGTPRPGSVPVWVPVVGGLGLLTAIAGGVLLRRRRPA